MKAGWGTRKLGEVCGFEGGSQPPKSQFIHEKRQGYVRFIQIRDFGSDKNVTYIPGSKKNRLCTENDILIGRYGASVGKILTGKAGAYNVALMKTIPNPELLENKWFYNYLLSDEFQSRLLNVASRSAQDGFSKDDIYNFPVPVPPLPEQQRIVTILDESFAAIATAKANAEKNLLNARALFESHLQSVFTQRGKGWLEMRLDELCKFSSGGTPSKSNSGYWNGKTPWISGRDMKSTRLTDSVLHISQAAVDESSTRMASAGTLLILVRGMGLAHGAQIGELMVASAFNQDIRGIHPKPNLLPRYLLFALRDRINSSDTVLSNAAHGTLKIDSDELQKVMIPFPPLEQQRRIVAAIDALSEETQRLARIYEQKLTALEKLKKSLLHQAFTGQLTKEAPQSVIIPFPSRVPNITDTDLHAGILAIAYDFHERANKQKYFGHVKAEKIAHMIEARVGIDLGREPFKDAAGPNDFKHLKSVEFRAKKADFFAFQKEKNAGYTLTKGRNFDSLITKTRAALGELNQKVDDLLKLMLPLDTQQAEVFATVYAAWNNLLLDNQPITDERIVHEARENWHPDKLKIPRDKFFKAITWIKEKNLCPEGKGKKVLKKAA